MIKTGIRESNSQEFLKKSPLIDIRLWLFRLALGAAITACAYANLPWWTLVIPSFVGGLGFTNPRRSFLQVSIIAALVWMTLAILQDVQTGGRLGHRIAEIFHVYFGIFAYLLTGLIAGVTAGAAAWCGQTIRRLTSSTTRVLS